MILATDKTGPWRGVKWVLSARGETITVCIINGIVIDGPTGTKGRKIEEMIAYAKRYGGEMECLGVSNGWRNDQVDAAAEEAKETDRGGQGECKPRHQTQNRNRHLDKRLRQRKQKATHTS